MYMLYSLLALYLRFLDTGAVYCGVSLRKLAERCCMKLYSFLALSFSLVFAAQVQAYMLDDHYIGGDDHGYGDVIGHTNMFDVAGLDVAVSGTQVTVDIYTTFWDDIGVYGSLALNGKGIGVGDLMLGSSWNPNGSASNGYLADNAASGTLWSHAVSVDDAYSTTGGSARLYALNGSSNDENLLLSEDFLSAGVYRDGQEVAVDRASRKVDWLSGNSASWVVSSGKISFMFDAANTGLLSDGELALHWAMLCGNDVIEGAVPVASVDEPSSLALLALGALGLGWLRRRV